MTIDVCYSCHGPGPHGCQGGGCTCGCIPDIAPRGTVGKHSFRIEICGEYNYVHVDCPVPHGKVGKCSVWACDCIYNGEVGEGCWTLGRPNHPRKPGTCGVREWIDAGSILGGLFITVTGDVEIDEDGAVNLLTIDEVGARLGDPS